MSLSTSAINTTSNFNSEAALCTLDDFAKNNTTNTHIDEIGNFHRKDNQFAHSFLNDQINVDGDNLLLFDNNLLQLLLKLEKTASLPSCNDIGLRLDDFHLQNQEKLKKADIDKSKGKELVMENDGESSGNNDYYSNARRKKLMKRNRGQRSKREQINDKFQILENLIPKSNKVDFLRDHASILNNAAKRIKSLKRQIEILSTWPEQKQLEQAFYVPASAIHALTMMRPCTYAFGSAEPSSHMPTIQANLCPPPPANTLFAPLFPSTTPCQYPGKSRMN
ncbi:transcription factor PHYTOCHROME INTERACTING FACTOR-LIKE 15 isoform X2 [Beta vulgaris subsp. vulgaris]|uniref:transcription factor PHYTOCHROME INTERACTING FACTOR-LIKE 15 isoform X2 n=1 Tax=Beta vulgaris subsp. vulgaris TaxID=3555 RepID=UPI002036E7B2|nr:transcription factor PHYTOCHROME INTERACTING FACTOR-LIKE 15 isoform X2 [Beta vulgaris subsp. vulgaris]